MNVDKSKVTTLRGEGESVCEVIGDGRQLQQGVT